MENTMADKTSVSETGTLSGESEVTTAEYVTKSELNAMLNGFRAAFKKDFSKLETAFQSISATKDDEAAAPKGAKNVDPEKVEMQKQIKLLLDREKERAAELATQKLNSALRDHLTQAGVSPAHLEHALAYVSHKGLVKYDEEGNLKMKVNQVDYDIADGSKLWAKSDEAKLYLAPKNAVGSGQKGPVTQRPAQVDSMKAANDSFMEAIKQLPGTLNGL
jgi:hypothetical protein